MQGPHNVPHVMLSLSYSSSIRDHFQENTDDVNIRNERNEDRTFSPEYSTLLRTVILNIKERTCQSIATICNKFHMATCFDSQSVIFRPFELTALTKQ
jgi:hypothetical protein